ncbi:MAG: hypothetical protein AAGA60_18955 [Cyanobacteria bacterium P01_E01_bin.42]
MTQIISITISGKTYPVKDKLKKIGLKWTGNAWVGKFAITQIEKLKKFCRHYDLQYTIKGENLKEVRLPRGQRPLPASYLGAVMGEGQLQWSVEETLDIENQRRRKR